MFQKYLAFAIILVLALLFSCNKDDSPSVPTLSDREKFIGKWAGTYACSNVPGDTLVIKEGSGDLDVLVALHVYSGIDPEFLSAKLTEENLIAIDKQMIAGFEGSGEIRYSNGSLSLLQRGLGLSCKGSDYVEIQ